MENTLQPSLPAFRSRILAIEAIELSILGFLFWGLIAMIPVKEPLTLTRLIGFFIITQIVLLGSWLLYNIFLRVARALGRPLDVMIWFFSSVATGSYTLWAWTLLDLNRLLMVKLFYQGEVPVEYAWSRRSRWVRKAWEDAKKTGHA
jgi:hypothetical protein